MTDFTIEYVHCKHGIKIVERPGGMFVKGGRQKVHGICYNEGTADAIKAALLLGVPIKHIAYRFYTKDHYTRLVLKDNDTERKRYYAEERL